MKSFWQYVFPLIFGILIYASVRLVNDSAQGSKFWERPLWLNVSEVIFAMLTSYLMQFIITYFIKRFEKERNRPITKKTILREFFIVFLACELIINVTITPFAALTDDGLGVNDLAILNLIPSLYVLLYFAILRGNHYLNAFVEKQLLLEQITNEHLKSELKFLKAQFHPHFLFNALNTVYFQMDDDVHAAKRSIEKFSGLLRYQLYDQQQTVPIKQEIDYLMNFIELQEVRVSSKLILEVLIDETLNDQQIYPLLFLPFVENAFKYVGGDYKLSVVATLVNGEIIYKVFNSVPDVIPQAIRGGIGLENLRRRLELLYPGKYEMKTGYVEGGFLATLNLRIQELKPELQHEVKVYHHG